MLAFNDKRAMTRYTIKGVLCFSSIDGFPSHIHRTLGNQNVGGFHSILTYGKCRQDQDAEGKQKSEMLGGAGNAKDHRSQLLGTKSLCPPQYNISGGQPPLS